MNSSENIFLNKVTIIGVGLLGASFALALREKGLCKTIIGYGRSKDNLKKAKDLGIIDDYTFDLGHAAVDSDLIMLSTPVGVFLEIIRQISHYFKRGSIVTDVGSVKGKLVYDLEEAMPEGVFYVGTHPIAGSDKSGISDARADLFKSARCIITPTEKTDKDALEKVTLLWKEFGSHLEFMDPYKHDEVYAAVSHLPHIIAYSLVNTIGDIDSEFIRYAGQGFKDTTRIALSSPELWRDIVIYNRGNLIKLLDLFSRNIEKLKELLEKSDEKAIKEEFQKAKALRESLR